MSQIETGNVGRSARGKQVRHSACQTDWGKWKCSALRRSRRGGMESSAFRPWTWSDRANRWREGRKGGVCSKSQDGWRDSSSPLHPFRLLDSPFHCEGRSSKWPSQRFSFVKVWAGEFESADRLQNCTNRHSDGETMCRLKVSIVEREMGSDAIQHFPNSTCTIRSFKTLKSAEGMPAASQQMLMSR